MVPLVAAIIWLGVYPAPVLRRMQTSAERFVNTVQGRSTTPVASAREVVR
jgi:NADH:ubiquinone oxidoreductase subunit 4 (subunit M)